MNAMTRTLALMTAGCLLSMTASAGGFYLGGAVGAANLDDDFDGLAIDADSTSFRVVVGWQVNDYFAAEAGYHNFGDFDASVEIDGMPAEVSLSADGFVFGVAGSVPLSSEFSLVGRVGFYFWDGNADVNAVSQASPDDTNPYFGVGAAYDFTERFSVLADWTRYDLEEVNASVLAIGVRYRFGVD